ncbi:MAG: M23 family metallopeptidase, partial [Chloroflexi bacterium]|nr:M23 family metallopeptidase [Chloroflexota bacterium]
AWVVERPVAIDEDSLDAFLHPYDAAAYREFRVAQSGQDVYIIPGGAVLANQLTQNAVINVSIDSQTKHGTDIWWKLYGWIAERPVDIPANAAGVYMQRMFPPKKAVYRVTTSDRLAIRSDPSVPGDNEPDNLITRVDPDTELVVFEGEAYTHTDSQFVWRRHEQGWSAERMIGGGVFLVKKADVKMPLEVKFLIVDDSPPMYTLPDTDTDSIAAHITKDTIVDVDPGSRFERDGLVWWKVAAWVKERSIYTGEGEPGVFLQPTADGEVSRFRVMSSGQDLFPMPDPNAEPIATELTPNLIVEVDPKSRDRRRGLVWWKVEGWAMEKVLPENDGEEAQLFLQEVPPPPSVTMKFRVVNKGGVWIRSMPGVPPPPMSNETIIGDLKEGDVIDVIKASRTDDGKYIFWQHADKDGKPLNKWTAEVGPSRTYMEAVEELPPLTKFVVKQDGFAVHTGPGETTAKLAASLRKDAVLYADTKSRQTRSKKVWWKISGWIVERRAELPPRDDDALLMPHNDANTVQFLVAAPDRDILGGPAVAEKRISSGLRQGAIIDTESGSYLKQDGFVWRKVNGWVVEREANQPENNAALVRQEIEVDLDTKIRFQVVFPGNVNVRSSPEIPPRSKKSNVLGEVRTGRIVDAYVYDQEGNPGPIEDKAGYTWWRHDSGHKDNRPDSPIFNGWTAEKHVDVNGTVTTFMKRLDDDALRPTIAFRVNRADPVYLIPDKNAGIMAERLSVGGTIFVDEHSRFEQDGLVWWRMSGWMAEREGNVVMGDENAFLQPANEQKFARFRVIFQGDINVRGDAVFVNDDSNVVGEVWTGDILQAYLDSRTEAGDFVWWRHDNGRKKEHPETRIPDGWCAELDNGRKKIQFLERLPDGNGSNDPIEAFYQQPEEIEVNVNLLPGRDRLFDRPPVDLSTCFILQHYGNTQEAFTSRRYVDVFQGMHSGIDFGILRGKNEAADAIVPVYAGVTGKVVEIYTRFYRPIGVKVRVGSLDIIYGHLGAHNVSVGMEVRPDMVVGHIANLRELQQGGPDFFPHLHFEVRFNKTAAQRCLHPLMFYPAEIRQAIIRTTTSPPTNHFHQSARWGIWGSVLEQPVIKLNGGLIGPLSAS